MIGGNDTSFGCFCGLLPRPLQLLFQMHSLCGTQAEDLRFCCSPPASPMLVRRRPSRLPRGFNCAQLIPVPISAI